MNETESDLITNRDQVGDTWGRDLALDCLTAGIRAADPSMAIRESLSFDGTELTVDGVTYDLASFDQVIVLGGGNAAGYAASALEDLLGGAIDDGIVVTDNPVETDRIRMLPGDHPIPGDRGVKNTRELLTMADDIGGEAFVITLITGGGSALLAATDQISLDSLQSTTEALLASGATIHEINAVRKHLSSIKGGQLARRVAPATVVGLLCSDVVGDDPSVIASGPLSPDNSTYADAIDVLNQYRVEVPDNVRDRLRAGAAGELPETPTTAAECFERVQVTIIVSNGTATTAASAIARENGFRPMILGSRIRGRASEVTKVLIGIAEEVQATGTPVEPPAALISGGETTVEITESGIGGPNQELAVSAALELTDEGITLTAVDTDGIDGNSDAAGGIVTADTVDNPRRAREAIRNNDTGPYLKDVNGAIHTGSTTTNVNDLHVLVVEDNQSDNYSND